MQFYPESGTLSEDGGAAPAASSSKPSNGNGGGGGGNGGAQGSIFSSGAGMPVVNAGEIMLSRAESAALAAMETEPDEAHGMKRARAESGLADYQLKILKRRATHALSKGITLRGQGFIRKPTGGPQEEPSLLRKAKKEDAAMTEALRLQYRTGSYSLPEDSDYKFPAPHSQGEPDSGDSVHLMYHGMQLPRKAKPGEVEEAQETNAQSTMAKLTMASRRMRRKKDC
jgi:hypothetical protein